MKDIDFLPQRYRRDRAGKTAVLWRISSLAAVACVLAGAWLFDLDRLRRLEQQLADATRQHEAALTLANQASTLKSQWSVLNAEAELWTYLRHPWPKTQILASIARSLPEGLSLDELRIDRGEVSVAASAGLLRDRVPATQGAKEAGNDGPTAAQRDLAHLQSLCDPRPMVVQLKGVAIDMAELHAWLAVLAKAPLFSAAELVSLERGQLANPNVYRFAARLIVRPGYGQPAGPTKLLTAVTVESSPQRHASRAGANHGS
jgi:hypothetical protein